MNKCSRSYKLNEKCQVFLNTFLKSEDQILFGGNGEAKSEPF